MVALKTQAMEIQDITKHQFVHFPTFSHQPNKELIEELIETSN
jgi:hypothetical protein